MGALTGIFCAFLFRKTYVPSIITNYSFDDDTDESGEILNHTGDSDFYYKIDYRNNMDKVL